MLLNYVYAFTFTIFQEGDAQEIFEYLIVNCSFQTSDLTKLAVAKFHVLSIPCARAYTLHLFNNSKHTLHLWNQSYV